MLETQILVFKMFGLIWNIKIYYQRYTPKKNLPGYETRSPSPRQLTSLHSCSAVVVVSGRILVVVGPGI